MSPEHVRVDLALKIYFSRLSSGFHGLVNSQQGMMVGKSCTAVCSPKNRDISRPQPVVYIDGEAQGPDTDAAVVCTPLHQVT